MTPTQPGPRRVVLFGSPFTGYCKEALIHTNGSISIRETAPEIPGDIEPFPALNECVILTAQQLDQLYIEAKQTNPCDGAAMRAEDV